MSSKKERLEEYKNLAKGSKGMKELIEAHLVENCPKYDKTKLDGCISYLTDCARLILGGKSGEVSNDVCFRICRDYFDDELWREEKPKKKNEKNKESEKPEEKSESICKKCGKAFLHLWKDGLCVDCYKKKEAEEKAKTEPTQNAQLDLFAVAGA